MNPSKRVTSHVFDAPPKKGEIGLTMRQMAEAHKRLMPVTRCHPWRAKFRSSAPPAAARDNKWDRG